MFVVASKLVVWSYSVPVAVSVFVAFLSLLFPFCFFSSLFAPHKKILFIHAVQFANVHVKTPVYIFSPYHLNILDICPKRKKKNENKCCWSMMRIKH